MLKREDVGGVLPLLLSVSGYAAVERGSEFVEPCDLLKAIYVVDLEHVSKYWHDWEGFERLIIQARLANGIKESYLNRTLYLANVQALSTRQPDQFLEFGRVSQSLQEVVAAARTTARERDHVDSPSSKDLLFAIYSRDGELGKSLTASGLVVDELMEAVSRVSR